MWQEKKKAKLNFIIDAVAFAAFVLLVSTGLLMRYVLPPGSGHFALLWGMDRHEWGQIHFWIAVIMIASIILHIILHWRWIVSMIEGRDRSGIRVIISIVGVIIVLILAVMPFFSSVEMTGDPPHRMRSIEHGASADYHK